MKLFNLNKNKDTKAFKKATNNLANTNHLLVSILENDGAGISVCEEKEKNIAFALAAASEVNSKVLQILVQATFNSLNCIENLEETLSDEANIDTELLKVTMKEILEKLGDE